VSKAKRNCMRVTQAIIALLGPQRKDCKTLTFDNGKECAEHEFIAQCLTAKVCFAHPYCSWELGLNENHNALLRQFFPKQTNLLKVSQDQVNDAVYSLNHRPRKCLGYRTPHEVFYRSKMLPLKIPTDALCSRICVKTWHCRLPSMRIQLFFYSIFQLSIDA
jgi:IS30 family transposase